MSRNEKQFQAYFMKIAKPMNYHRTALVSGDGFPDITGFHGERHSLVELKDLDLGKTGDRKLRQYFKPSQPPWYLSYLINGGKRLFVAFRISTDKAKWYGLLHLNIDLVKRLASNDLTYVEMTLEDRYKAYDYCKEMIEDIECFPN